MEREPYTAAFKTKPVLEPLRGERELNEIAAKYLIDMFHTDHPAWSSWQLSKQLKAAGMKVGRLKTRRYMEEMGIEAIYLTAIIDWYSRLIVG